MWFVAEARFVGVSWHSGRMSERGDPDVVIDMFPIGEQVSGRIRSYLLPEQRTGLVVDLGTEASGFVDGVDLPFDLKEWPAVDSVTVFEVLRHDIYRRARVCKLLLWPLDPRFRNPRSTHWGFSDEEWPAIKARYRAGSLVRATVTSVTPGNRWYTVRFSEAWGRITWKGQPPQVGTTAEFVVTKVLDTTKRILLEPVGDVPVTPAGRPDLDGEATSLITESGPDPQD
jgi:hypothetical protein